jgi:hypothetical protein
MLWQHAKGPKRRRAFTMETATIGVALDRVLQQLRVQNIMESTRVRLVVSLPYPDDLYMVRSQDSQFF